jgi:hypothetical protein
LLGYTSSLKYIILFYTFLSNLNSRKISNLNIFNGLLEWGMLQERKVWSCEFFHVYWQHAAAKIVFVQPIEKT